jgi:hypothetical protein
VMAAVKAAPVAMLVVTDLNIMVTGNCCFGNCCDSAYVGFCIGCLL